MSKAKKFIKTAGIFFVGNILSKLIGFFLLPLYTSYLSPTQFGKYDLVVSLISFFVPIAFFQIWDGMYRYSFNKQNLAEKYSVITNSFSVLAAGLIIYSIVFWIIYKIFHFEFVWLIFLYGILFAIQYQYTFIARAFLLNKLFVVSGLINTLLSAIVNVSLILQFNLGVESLYIAAILGCSAQIFLIEIVLQPLKNFHLHDINVSQIFEMLKFSLPLCVATISYWMLSGYTKIVIIQQLGTYANGLYAVANKFSSMIMLVITVFQYAWNEMAYLLAEDDDKVIKYQQSIEYIFKVIIIGSGAFMLFIKLIFPYLINSAYHDALSIIPLSLIGVGANSFAGFIGTIFMAEKQTKWIFWTTIISAITNIVCLWIFTPVWGLQGAIGALCLAFIILAIIRTFAIMRIFAINLPKTNVVYFFLLVVSLYAFYMVNNVLLLCIFIILLVVFLIYSLRHILIPLTISFTKKRR